MKQKNSIIQKIALFFPPFLFNHYLGPYLAIPHLYSYLKSQGVEGVQIYDINSRVIYALISKASKKEMLEDIEADLNSIKDKELVKKLLDQKFIISYFLDDQESLLLDRKSYTCFGSLICDRYYRKLKKNIPSQIEALNQNIGINPLYSIIEKTIHQMPEIIKLIGISVITAEQLYPALLLAKYAKEKWGQQVHITLGGSILSFFNEKEYTSILTTPYVDSIVKHEGEKPLLGLVEYIEGKRKIEEIPNLLYCQEGVLHTNPVTQAIPLNECPAPLFPQEFLNYYKKPVYLPVWVTRGCYWGKCIFCDYPHISGNENKAEIIQVEKLIAHIEKVTRKYHTHTVQLITECLPPSFCTHFIGEMEKKKLKIDWITYLRVEKSYNKELCQQMSLSGCREVHIGVESFNPRQLRIMRKGYKKADIISMLKSFRDAKIFASINVIIDFPSVTHQEMVETLEYLENYHSLYDSLTVYPFLLSRLSEIAHNPSTFGLATRGQEALDHCRGFHYLKFTRTRGATEAQIAKMTKKYFLQSQIQERRRVAEQSLMVFKDTPLSSLLIQPQPRIYFCSALEEKLVARILNLTFDNEQENLLFDLDSKAIQPCPKVLKTIYQSLPKKWVPLAAINKAIRIEDKLSKKKESVLRDIIEAGLCLNLFALSNDLSEIAGKEQDN